MAERKVLNFYIPPDFDPSKLPKGVRHSRMEVTMMLPFSIQCITCGEFMSRGKKFNAKVEQIPGAEYLGVKVWRFIGKCVACNAPYSFKTDPEHMDFAAEKGITRNFEPWRANAEEQETAKAEREAEEKNDAMKALENRILDSKRQMDIQDAIEETRAMRARQAKFLTDPDALLAALQDARKTTSGASDAASVAATESLTSKDEVGEEFTEEEIAQLAGLYGQSEPASNIPGGGAAPAPVIKRIIQGDDFEEKGADPALPKPLFVPRLAPKTGAGVAVAPKSVLPTGLRIRPREPVVAQPPSDPAAKRSRTEETSSEKITKPAAGLVGYGSDSDE